MTPTYLNSPSHFSFQVEQYHDDLHDHDHPIIISPNKIYHDGHGASSASCDLSSSTFSNSSSLITQNDPSVFHHKVLQQAHVQQDQADDYDFQGGLYGVESYSSSNDKELKHSIWEKESKFEHHHQWYHESTSTCSKLKWMSKNMKLPQKMKKNNIDPTVVNPTPSATTLIKPEDHKKDQPPSSPMDTDISSNTASSNSSTNLIRVCSDCSTTKTPLWRSGPQGPKSLCNACGIRQRKARRAMAEANETSVMTMTRLLGVKITKTKKQQRDKGSSTSIGLNVVAKFKKRMSKITSDSKPTSSSWFEDLTLKLTNDLAHFDNHVFPQDEKEAAILLMALSCDRFLRSP